MIACDNGDYIMSDVKNIKEKITQNIEALKHRIKDHTDLLGRILEADNRSLYGVDLVVIAVMQRSISLIDGFTKMVEDRNYLCSNALLRLQLDNIIRLYACWLVDDPHAIALVLLEGKPLYKVKSRENKPLSDSYFSIRNVKIVSMAETGLRKNVWFYSFIPTSHDRLFNRNYRRWYFRDTSR